MNNSNQYFFSIIIPTYNVENIINSTLNSILNQTFNNYEILIIDNLSSDKTLEIASSYNDKRIKIFFENDSGIYDAMNKGIKLSSGDWIYFLGCDDELFNKNVLYDIQKIIKEFECDIIYGNVFNLKLNKKYDGEFSFSKILKKNICHQSLFFKKSVFDKIGLFDLKYKIYSDWDHNIKWFSSNSISKKYIDIIIANYGGNGYSSSHIDSLFLKEKILPLRKKFRLFL
jgi:glycosyltransferase involved in cell wall biosynthesis